MSSPKSTAPPPAAMGGAGAGEQETKRARETEGEGEGAGTSGLRTFFSTVRAHNHAAAAAQGSEVAAGERPPLAALVGPGRAGKTTLLNCVYQWVDDVSAEQPRGDGQAAAKVLLRHVGLPPTEPVKRLTFKDFSTLSPEALAAIPERVLVVQVPIDAENGVTCIAAHEEPGYRAYQREIAGLHEDDSGGCERIPSVPFTKAHTSPDYGDMDSTTRPINGVVKAPHLALMLQYMDADQLYRLVKMIRVREKKHATWASGDLELLYHSVSNSKVEVSDEEMLAFDTELRKRYGEDPRYYDTDEHWTTLIGAYLLKRDLLSRSISDEDVSSLETFKAGFTPWVKAVLGKTFIFYCPEGEKSHTKELLTLTKVYRELVDFGIEDMYQKKDSRPLYGFDVDERGFLVRTEEPKMGPNHGSRIMLKRAYFGVPTMVLGEGAIVDFPGVGTNHDLAHFHCTAALAELQDADTFVCAAEITTYSAVCYAMQEVFSTGRAPNIKWLGVNKYSSGVSHYRSTEKTRGMDEYWAQQKKQFLKEVVVPYARDPYADHKRHLCEDKTKTGSWITETVAVNKRIRANLDMIMTNSVAITPFIINPAMWLGPNRDRWRKAWSTMVTTNGRILNFMAELSGLPNAKDRAVVAYQLVTRHIEEIYKAHEKANARPIIRPVYPKEPGTTREWVPLGVELPREEMKLPIFTEEHLVELAKLAWFDAAYDVAQEPLQVQVMLGYVETTGEPCEVATMGGGRYTFNPRARVKVGVPV